MRLVLALLIAISLGGCLHIDVHKHEVKSTTNNTSEERHVTDN